MAHDFALLILFGHISKFKQKTVDILYVLIHTYRRSQKVFNVRNNFQSNSYFLEMLKFTITCYFCQFGKNCSHINFWVANKIFFKFFTFAKHYKSLEVESKITLQASIIFFPSGHYLEFWKIFSISMQQLTGKVKQFSNFPKGLPSIRVTVSRRR